VIACCRVPKEIFICDRGVSQHALNLLGHKGIPSLPLRCFVGLTRGMGR